MKLVDRYIIKELVNPFLFGLGIFIAAFVVSNILLDLMRLVMERGVAVFYVFELFIYKLPYFMVLAFPMSMLLATLLSFGRLSTDSEFIAMQAGGISFLRLVVPLLLAALLVSLAAMGFGEIIVPRANKAAEELMLQVTSDFGGKPREDVIIHDRESPQRSSLIYAKRFEPRDNMMYEVTVVQFLKEKPAVIICAARLVWTEGRWQFFDGFMQNIGSKGGTAKVEFKSQDIRLNITPEDVVLSQERPEEMNLKQLSSKIRGLAKVGADVNPLLVKLHLKLAVPFVSVVFALIGAPLGTKPKRAGKSVGLGLSLIIIFFYYIILHYTTILGEHGVLNPVIAAWAANIVTGLLGIGLIIKEL